MAPIKIDGRILVQGGGVWNDVDDMTFDPLIPAGSLFVGAYTLLGRLF